GTLIIREDEDELPFFVLLKGSVQIVFSSHDGQEVLAELVRAPAAFGATELLAETGALGSVKAIERCQGLSIDPGVLAEALDRSPALLRNLLVEQAQRVAASAKMQRSLAFDPVDTRLAKLLTNYLELYGLPVEGGMKIRIPLNQTDLANAVGA